MMNQRTVGIPHRPFFLYPFLRKKRRKTMKYRIITLIGLAGSTLAVCFGGWDKFLQTLLNITVRQSRQSGVARATCPD